MDGGAYTYHITHCVCKRLFHSSNILYRVVELLGTKLNVYVEGVGVVLSAKLDKIVLRESFCERNTLTPRIIIISSLLPIGCAIRI